ncbi:MAG: hypothetical protein ACRD20_08305 [Terriglobales bacterium]
MGNRISIWRAALLLVFVGYCGSAGAQNPQLETKNGRRFPTVTFSSVAWGASPPYYSIAIDSGGNATYQSAPQSVERTGAPYDVEFLASASTRQTVFDKVEQLKFLKLPTQNVQHFRGPRSIKTLAFREGNTRNWISYQTGRNPEIRQLTSLFQNISATMEFGRRLAYLHQHGSPRISEELKHMQQLAQRGRLPELQAVEPALENIASDAKIKPADRKRAGAILVRARNGQDQVSSQRSIRQ